MMFFSCVYSLYALLSKKHAKVMEHIKQAESSPQENSEGARHSDYVGISENCSVHPKENLMFNPKIILSGIV